MEKNKKMIGRKVIRILISIVVAVAIWAYADYENSTEVTVNVRNVPVEFTGEDTTLAEKGLMITSGYDTTVNLKLSGPRNVMYQLDKSQIRIVADTSDITTTGVQALSYTVVYPDNVSRSSITVKSTSAYTVTVTVGELYTKEIPVKVVFTGSPAEGYYSQEATLDPATMVLRGQRDDLINVEYAAVTVDISGATSTVVDTEDYILYDYNGIAVENDAIRTSTKLIKATVPILTSKIISLNINYVEAPGSTMDQVKSTIVPATIKIEGTEEDLQSIDSLTLDTIYLQDLSDTQTLTYRITLPEGVSIVSDDPVEQAVVTIVVTDVSEKSVTTDNFNFTNVPDGFDVTAVTEDLDVKLRGLEEEINSIQPENVVVNVDLTGYGSAGNYTVSATISITGYSNVSAKGSYQVIVQLSEKTADQTTDQTTGQGN